jgi:hypothetical protein
LDRAVILVPRCVIDAPSLPALDRKNEDIQAVCFPYSFMVELMMAGDSSALADNSTQNADNGIDPARLSGCAALELLADEPRILAHLSPAPQAPPR